MTPTSASTTPTSSFRVMGHLFMRRRAHLGTKTVGCEHNASRIGMKLPRRRDSRRRIPNLGAVSCRRPTPLLGTTAMNPIVFALRHPVTVITGLTALVVGAALALGAGKPLGL